MSINTVPQRKAQTKFDQVPKDPNLCKIPKMSKTVKIDSPISDFSMTINLTHLEKASFGLPYQGLSPRTGRFLYELNSPKYPRRTATSVVTARFHSKVPGYRPVDSRLSTFLPGSRNRTNQLDSCSQSLKRMRK